MLKGPEVMVKTEHPLAPLREVATMGVAGGGKAEEIAVEAFDVVRSGCHGENRSCLAEGFEWGYLNG